MKMKIIITLLLLPLPLKAQLMDKPVYLVCTSVQTEYAEKFTVNRVDELPQDYYSKNTRGIAVHKYPPIYIVISVFGGWIDLYHRNYNVAEIARYRALANVGEPINPNWKDPEMEIIEKPISFLKEIEYIDLDEFLKKRPTDEQLWELGDRINNKNNDKKVYLIDRNDFQEGTIKLIEVKLVVTNKPVPKLIIPRKDTVIITFTH